MIKANELKPDNLIYFKNALNDNGKRIAVVDSIKKSIASFQEKHDHGVDIWLPLSWCEGIPLTPEWLQRFGLTQKLLEPDDLPQWSNLNMNIAQYTDGFYLYTITSDPWHDQAVGKKIEFVHTLQNISLDLFGEELNVKL